MLQTERIPNSEIPTYPDQRPNQTPLRKMFNVNATDTIDVSVDEDVTTSSSLVEYAEKKNYVDVTAEQLQELEKKIVREAQQAAFAKDIAELMGLPQPKDKGVLRSKIFTSGQLRRKKVFIDDEGCCGR